MYKDPGLNTYFSSRVKRRRRKRLVLFLLLFFLIVSLLAAFSQFIKNNISRPDVLSNQTKDRSLKTTVDGALQETKGTYGIVIKNLKTNESYYRNEHQSFEAGSLYKLWVMATVYKQIQEGTLTKEATLSADIAALNQKFNIDPDEAELSGGIINFTVQSALTQMITISHNYAALILTEKVKLSTVAKFLKETGLNESVVGTEGDSPKTTPSDIALFYEKLYKKELANEQYTNEMVGLLKNQKLNDALPKFLPEQSEVAHKTGDIGWFKHDAGIIFTESGNYIIVVMSESNSPTGAQERIALLSKAVFDYFAKP